MPWKKFDFQNSENKIFTSQKEVFFVGEHAIKKIIQGFNFVLVLYAASAPDDKKLNNLICVNEQGEVFWRVKCFNENIKDHYFDVRQSNDTFFADSEGGLTCQLNMKNGEILAIFEGPNLLDENKKVILTMPKKLKKVLYDNDKIYALMDGYTRDSAFVSYIRGNVWCADFNGSKLWESEEIKSPTKYDCYSNMFLSEGKLFAISGSGYQVELDKNTGKILNEEFLK